MNAEKRRILEDRAAKLSSFKQHPHWDELIAEFNRRRERNERRYVGYLKSGDAAKAQREFDHAQGFDEALVWVQNVVEKAADTLERVLRESETEET